MFFNQIPEKATQLGKFVIEVFDAEASHAT